MKKIFYRFNNDIYIDYQAIHEWASDLGIDPDTTQEICQLKSRLQSHESENTLLLVN